MHAESVFGIHLQKKKCSCFEEPKSLKSSMIYIAMDISSSGVQFAAAT